MELKVTPARHDSNSYISLSDAETYLSTYNRASQSDTWGTLTDDQKKFALFIAAKALDTFSFKGQKVTEDQPLAFPRFTWRQVNVEKRKPYESFFKATRSDELTNIVTSGIIAVSNNKLVDQSSSADAFYSDYYYENININQIIKVTGLSTNTYLTIKDIDFDGSFIETFETIIDEPAPSGGVDIDAVPLFGYPDTIGHAQVEIALQYVNEMILQGDINKLPEPSIKSWTMGNSMEVTYQTKTGESTKFSPDRASTVDIVYHLLGDWVSATGGCLV